MGKSVLTFTDILYKKWNYTIGYHRDLDLNMPQGMEGILDFAIPPEDVNNPCIPRAHWSSSLWQV